MVRLFLAAAILICTFAFSAEAKEATKPPPLTLKTSEVIRLNNVPNYDAGHSLVCCAMEVLESGPKHVFVYLHARFDVAWTKELTQISYYGLSAIRLKLPGQTDPSKFIAPWGTMDWYPEVRLVSPSISASRHRRWPKETNDVDLDALFTVPSGVTKATLIVGRAGEPQAEFPIDLAGKISELPSAGSQWKVAITSLAIAREVPTKRSSRDSDLLGHIRPSMGKFIKVDMTLMPNKNLKTNQKSLTNAATFVSKHVWLVGPEGLPLALVGEARKSGQNMSLSSETSNTTNWQGQGTTGKINRTYYFLGSGAPGAYQLYFKDAKVGSANLK